MTFFLKSLTSSLIVKVETLLLFLLLLGFVGCSEKVFQKEMIYVGTFDSRGSEELYVYEFERKTGKMNQVQIVTDQISPNFQALHPDDNTLYSVSDEVYSESTGYGTITAYRTDPETDFLTIINEQSVEGRGPAHISFDPLGRFAYLSNYSEGNLSVFRIDENGSMSKAVDVIQHESSSINERRQSAPHMHSIIPSYDGQYIYVSDLGLDKIFIYRVNDSTGKLTPAEITYVENTPGSGACHFTIHLNGKFAYSAEELSSTVAVFAVDQEARALTQIQRINMMKEGFDDRNSTAGTHLSPRSTFLHASNRRHNNLVIYEVDENRKS